MSRYIILLEISLDGDFGEIVINNKKKKLKHLTFRY